MPDPIPASALSAAALAIEAQPAGSSAPHLARVALEAAVPLLRAAGGEAAAVEPGEYGPFDTERQALATRSAALIRAAFDAHPGVGASAPECLRVMTDACETAGVALGKLDLSFLKGLAWGETFYSVSLAGMITRAAQRPETVTEWGACRRGEAEPFTSSMDEAAIRRFAEDLPIAVTGLVRREVTPWTPVPGDGDS